MRQYVAFHLQWHCAILTIMAAGAAEVRYTKAEVEKALDALDKLKNKPRVQKRTLDTTPIPGTVH
jgi:hypothetical protein